MANLSLEAKLQGFANPVDMLRNSPIGPYVFPMKSEFSNWRDEQRAWKQTAVLFDQSFHMLDVYLEGPDTQRLLNDLSVNSFANYGRNKAKQYVVCNYDGYVIGDAVLFGLEDDKACVVGRPATGNWISFHAETGDYDVQLTRDERSLDNDGSRLTFRYQVQGPNAAKILDAAVDGGLPEIPFFNLGEITIDGVPVRALNHSMSRVPGLELVGPAGERERVWEAIVRAGEDYGLRPGGGRAYSTVAIESGWIPSITPAIYSGDAMRPYREWLAADGWEANASIGGSFVSDNIEDYYQRPWDLGLGRTVKFDHDFIGREALEAAADGSHRQKVWLRWNDDDIVAIYRSMLEDGVPGKYMDLPAAHYATLPFDQILKDDRLVGLSTYPVYTANVGGWFSLCMVDETEAVDGAEVAVVWGEPNGGSAKPVVERHVQTTVRATLSTQSPAA
jgi:glycine cleavage system aminomethyltransferase T